MEFEYFLDQIIMTYTLLSNKNVYKRKIPFAVATYSPSPFHTLLKCNMKFDSHKSFT